MGIGRVGSAIRQKRKREQRITDGKCASCGNFPVKPDYLQCDNCIKRHNEKNIADREVVFNT